MSTSMVVHFFFGFLTVELILDGELGELGVGEEEGFVVKSDGME